MQKKKIMWEKKTRKVGENRKKKENEKQIRKKEKRWEKKEIMTWKYQLSYNETINNTHLSNFIKIWFIHIKIFS